MSFLALTSALIAAGITIPSLVALYFLKRRRRIVPVSSTFLWKQALQDLQVNAPFQRIRRNLLLMLQMIILLGLLLAFARPSLREAAKAGQQVIIVIDHSASMNATDGAPTRLTAAQEHAVQLVDDLSGNEAMVISFAQQAQVVESFTTDRVRLRRAIRSIRGTDLPTRLGPVVNLIEPFARKQSGGLVVYVISDGRVREAGELTLGGVDLRYIRVGQGADNLGIAALAARRDYEQPENVKVMARLVNAGDAAIDAALTLQYNGQVHTVRKVTAPAGSNDLTVQFDLIVPDTAFVQLKHDYKDSLGSDDRASITIAPPQQHRVMLITPGNRFLTQAIRSAGVRELVTVSPDQYDPAAARSMDVLVFDRYSPTSTPTVDSLYFAGGPLIAGLSITRGKGQSSMLDWRRDHALLRYVTLDDVVAAQAVQMSLPDEARTMATTEHGPMIATLETQGTRHVVVGFDPLQSNWPMQIGFVVFVTNALDWLGAGGTAPGGTGGAAYRSGDVAVVDVEPGRPIVNYTGPRRLVVKTQDDKATLPAFERVGLYFADAGVRGLHNRLSVNLADAHESDIRPTDQLEIGTTPATAINKGSSIVRHEVWPWFVWVALAVLMIEWVVYTRRMHL